MYFTAITQQELIKVLGRESSGGYVMIRKNIPQPTITRYLTVIPNYFKAVSEEDMLTYFGYKALHGHDEAYALLSEKVKSTTE